MKCPRTTNGGKDRCGWEGDEAEAHDSPDGLHWPCLLGGHFLRDEERRVCSRCVAGALLDLEDIVTGYAELSTVVEASGYRMRDLPGGDALVMLAAGSVEGGGPDDHPVYGDPIPVLADLHSWERDWRETFGHSHYPAWQVTVTSVTAYLREWMWLAARTHEAFDDYVRDVRTLRSRLTHVVGLANDPLIAPASCFDCGNPLARDYRPPTGTPTDVREGSAAEGLPDDWTCLRCRRIYTPAEYWLAVRAVLEAEAS